jgi:hypothetical protein
LKWGWKNLCFSFGDNPSHKKTLWKFSN